MEYQDRVEPCKHTGYLVFGCFMAAACIVMMTHIFNHIALIVDDKTSAPFLNAMLEKCHNDK
jgi:hypothetical protein